MADGALAHSPADLAVAVTGIAGPGGAHAGQAGRHRLAGAGCAAATAAAAPNVLQLGGDRAAVRAQTVASPCSAARGLLPTCA